MPSYDYYCKKCDVNHTDLRTYEEREKTSTCPECGKRRCPRTYDLSKSRESGGVSIKGGGTPKFYGSLENRKKNERKWLEDEVKNADKATQCETGVSPYAKMGIDHEYWAKEGVAKKVTKKEAALRKKNARKLTQGAGKNIAAEHVTRMTKGDKVGIRKGKDQI